MNKEEKEQWLYEEYQFTSNFDFRRLDKYEEANDDLCIDDLILDYTMLYEFYKEEIERLQNIIKEVREYIVKHCVNERVSKEVGFNCYTMADTNELEYIMKKLGDDYE